MPETGVATSTVTNQLPPRTNVSHRWPRKWATLGGRGAPSTSIPPLLLDEPPTNGKSNGYHANGNGHSHRPSSSLFRKSSTISRTNGTTLNSADLTSESASLKKSRSLINVLRSKLNSPAVLRRFRTKSRESSKHVITEVNGDEAEKQPATAETNDEPKKSRKRDPSPMRRFTTRLAQLTRSSTHTSMDNEQQSKRSPSPVIHQQDQVDHINACYDEIRAKYFDSNNNTKSNTISVLSQHPCAPPSERLKEMLSTTTTSSIDYYDRPNLTSSDLPNRSLSTISINGSLLSHDLLNNSQQNAPLSPPRTLDDPLLVARKQSNIKLNCMLSGYGFTTPFGNQDKSIGGEHDLFKFHHYHDVGKRKYDFNFTSQNNRIYSSMRTRPMSRSIDSFRRATTTIETDLIPTNYNSVKSEDHLLLAADGDTPEENNELVIREDGDSIEPERKACTSKIHIQPAVAVNVKTFVTSSSTVPDEESLAFNAKDDVFERNFLRAVDRALGVVNKDANLLLQPIYDTPTKTDPSGMDLAELTERVFSSVNHSNHYIIEEKKYLESVDDEQPIDGTESPSVELFDRTGEILDNENINWQSSAVYDHQATMANGDHTYDHPTSLTETHVWSVVDDLTQKTQEILLNEAKVGVLND